MQDEKDNPLTFHAVGKEDGKSCQKVTVRMTIRKNDCRSNRPVSSFHNLPIITGI